MRIKTIAVSVLGFMASLFVACDEDAPAIGDITSAPSAISWSEGRLDIFCAGGDRSGDSRMARRRSARVRDERGLRRRTDVLGAPVPVK